MGLSRELIGLMGGEEGGVKWGFEEEEEVGLAIEELVPKGKGDKPFWVRGVDLLGYSLNSLRISNLGFEDAGSRRMSEVVRLQMSREETDRLLAVSDYKFGGFFSEIFSLSCSLFLHVLWRVDSEFGH